MKTDNSDSKKNAHCPRCQVRFECMPGSIHACWCSELELNKEEYRFVSSQFKGCLCSTCLKALKEEYALQKFNKIV